MSKFFKALEQAERERALRQDASRRESPEPGEVGRIEPPAPPPTAAASPSEEATRSARAPAPGPVAGPIPRPASAPAPEPAHGVDEHLVSLLSPTAFASEQYRSLRHLVEHLHKSSDLSVIAVSSPGERDGKTTTAINLAGALAQAAEARVLLVDIDLRHSSLLARLGLGGPGGLGLVDAVLTPNVSLDDVLRRWPSVNLSIVPAGAPTTSPYEVLQSPRLVSLIAEARRRYEYVVLDSPPVVPVPDGRLILELVDGLILVVAANQTPRRLLEEALNIVNPAKVVGLVFNGDDHPISGYYHSYTDATNGIGGAWRGESRKVAGMGRQRRSTSA